MQSEFFVTIDEQMSLHIYPANETELEVVVQCQGNTGRLPSKDFVAEVLNTLLELAKDYAEEGEEPGAVAERFEANLQNESLVQSVWANVKRKLARA